MSNMWGLVLAFSYLVAMIVIGLVVSKWIKSSEDFLISGREVGWFVLASGLAACQIAGTTVAGYPGTAYNNGWGAMWGALGWSISAFLYMFLFARFSRRTGALTIVEFFETQYDTPSRIIVAIGTIIALLFGGMAQYVGCANIIAGWLGINYNTAVIILGVATMIYMYTGGYWATVITDSIQFVICILAIYIVLPAFLLIKFGGFSYLVSGPNPVPAAMLQFPFGTIKISNLLMGSVTGLIAMNISFMWANSYYWGKAVAARSEKIAVKGFGIGALFILPFAFVSAMAGLYVRATVPNIKVSDQVFGYLLQSMHPLLAGFIMMAILAATQSTITPIVIGNSTIITRDIIGRMFPKANLLKVARVTTLVVSIVNMAIAIWFKQGALYGLAMMGAFVVPALPGLLGAVLAPKWVKKEGVVLGMLVAIPAGLYWHFFTKLSNTVMHTLYVTFILSAVILVLVSLIVNITGPWWVSRKDKQRMQYKDGSGKDLKAMRFEAACFEVAKPVFVIQPFVRWVENIVVRRRKDYVPEYLNN